MHLFFYSVGWARINDAANYVAIMHTDIIAT